MDSGMDGDIAEACVLIPPGATGRRVERRIQAWHAMCQVAQTRNREPLITSVRQDKARRGVLPAGAPAGCDAMWWTARTRVRGSRPGWTSA